MSEGLIKYINKIPEMKEMYDVIVVIDDEMNVVYFTRVDRGTRGIVKSDDVVGKSLYDIYVGITPENSLLRKVVTDGLALHFNKVTLTNYKGESYTVIHDVFPIKEAGIIVGAVLIGHYDYDEGEVYGATHVVSSAATEMYSVDDIIGHSSKMKLLRNQIDKLSETNSTVLIYGATGTGKELVAQSIHSESPRRNKIFISQNCAAIPGNLLETIFFGSVKGSYTGAEERGGIFEVADGGTLFLDEINSMDLSMQAKLLKVIEEKKITRVGGTSSKKVDVRIIAAVNEPPIHAMQEGRLRSDLFYRLSSVTVEIPLLKDRPEDIGLFAAHFIKLYNEEMGKNIFGVSDEVAEIFMNYDWPGNVREFKNVIEGAFNLCDSQIIRKKDLPSHILSNYSKQSNSGYPIQQNGMVSLTSGNPPSAFTMNHYADPLSLSNISMPQLFSGSLKEAMDAYESMLILDAIEKSRNLSCAAKELGITRQSLNQKIKKHNIHSRRD